MGFSPPMMTESEWFTTTDPMSLLGALMRLDLTNQEMKSRGRQYHLLAVGCCRLVENELPPVGRNGVGVLERYADGLATEEEKKDIHKLVEEETRLGWSVLHAVEMALSATFTPLQGANAAVHNLQWERDDKAISMLTALVRCVFGNPFRPVTLDAAWLTTDVVAIANSVYDDKAFDRLPILADALQDAGCDNEDVLNHCRQPGEHVRGCWVVDLLTGRK